MVDLVPRSFSAEMYGLLTNFAALAVQELERDNVSDIVQTLRDSILSLAMLQPIRTIVTKPLHHLFLASSLVPFIHCNVV